LLPYYFIEFFVSQAEKKHYMVVLERPKSGQQQSGHNFKSSERKNQIESKHQGRQREKAHNSTELQVNYWIVPPPSQRETKNKQIHIKYRFEMKVTFESLLPPLRKLPDV